MTSVSQIFLKCLHILGIIPFFGAIPKLRSSSKKRNQWVALQYKPYKRLKYLFQMEFLYNKF